MDSIFNFIKSSWPLIKTEIYSLVHEFWRSSKRSKGSNVAFIALIAKSENPCGFKDYRPISMVNWIYKIIAKILARRLKKVMSDLVISHQSSLIEEIQILDSILIAGELIDSCKRSKAKALILKLDFHKAFDSVSWSFLDWTLSQMGFPITWRKCHLVFLWRRHGFYWMEHHHYHSNCKGASGKETPYYLFSLC